MPARLVAARLEHPGARTLVLDAPGLPPALAGQHIDIRLTAADGYTAQRSYSLASAAGARPIEVTIDRLTDGEVSSYLVDVLGIGQEVEVRGPIGSWFVWRPEEPEPVQLVAGGSGVVPLMSMIRTHRAAGATTPMRLLYSAQSPEHAFYTEELDRLAGGPLTVEHRWTRRPPLGWAGPVGRIEPGQLHVEAGARTYVCGSNPFVESVASRLVAMGHDPLALRTERFGDTSS